MSRKTNFTLNDKERAVLAVLADAKRRGKSELMSLSDIAAKAFHKKGSSSGTKGNSWVRNSLRKPIRLGLVGHSGPRSGLYFRTDTKLVDLAKKAAAPSRASASEASPEA